MVVSFPLILSCDVVAAVGQLADFLGNERKLLQRGDDDRCARAQSVSELLAVLVDFLDDALLVFELINRVLQLLIKNASVRYHDDGVEDALKLSHRIELVVSRKDDRLRGHNLAVDFLFGDVEVSKPPQDVHQAVALPDLLPERFDSSSFAMWSANLNCSMTSRAPSDNPLM
jgi:hypothetical protein